MTKAHILVVEDDPSVVIFVVDQLEYLGYRVTVARDGREGLTKAQGSKPDLIVLDVMMPRMDGYEVCHWLKSSPETKDIPVLMLTARGQLEDKVRGFDIGADDYLAKPYDKAEFEARVRALLKRSSSPPFSPFQGLDVFSVMFDPGRQISIRVSGSLAFTDVTKNLLDIDPNVYSRQADNTPLVDWRFNSKHLGMQLYQKIFADHPKVLSIYGQVLGEVGDEEKLHLRFEASRDLLRVPFEFLFEGISAGGDYFVLRHPLSRALSGIRMRRVPLSPDFLNDLWAKGEPLKILLVASNTRPSIPGVDQEIRTLDDSLGTVFECRGISTQIRTIHTEHATYEVVREELRKREYHVFHYAGHGTYDERSPEKSCLSFWEKENRQGDVKKMPVSELQFLLRGSDLRFAYLSCCLGTKTGGLTKLLDDDFLGIADGIVHAGVPAVLGFRWPVSDNGSKAMARAFYRALADRGQIDTALLDARCQVAASDRDDITWLSPVLIIQV
jgi:DNA-binding response OmpR family regulator